LKPADFRRTHNYALAGLGTLALQLMSDAHSPHDIAQPLLRIKIAEIGTLSELFDFFTGDHKIFAVFNQMPGSIDPMQRNDR
jgi:hypothetical protein